MALPFRPGRADLHLVGRPSPEAAVPPELWGGIECTVNRVGDVWFDQIARSGHADRLDDLDRIAALGIRTLRYPLLWERVAPDGLERAAWRWSDERLGRLRELGIRPIVGLVHHGSGPAGTDLLDPGFAPGLAAFARAAAARYPWVEDWTPVNEPLTTARFAALYGHWYPHARSDRAFIRALVNQCTGVKLAMAAIRETIPEARLVQTEDLGKTWSTPRLAYQADFENERRWLTLDLLCGRVDRTHPLWSHLWWLGLKGEDLHHFVDDPCPPDVIGFNYYLTTERFLDDRLDHYPPDLRGGNGRDEYVDVEAVRVRREGIDGVGPLLREAWARYRRQLAITEAHLGCTREDQIRWLAEVWGEARAVRADGVDLRAVTVWSLLGAYDWHCLLTRCEDHYEPGVFDLRAPFPRPTALAALAAQLAAGQEPDHPLLADPGWWRRPERLLFPPWPPESGAAGAVAPAVATGRTMATAGPDGETRHRRGPGERGAAVAIAGRSAGRPGPGRERWRVRPPRQAQPLLIVGADEPLGRALVVACAARGIRATAVEVTAANGASLSATIDEHLPWAVIDARQRFGAAADGQRERGGRRAVEEVGLLAAACAEQSVTLVAMSSAHVFDGAKGTPYVESDPISPVGPRGHVHAAVEATVADLHPAPLIVRAGEALPSPDGGRHGLGEAPSVVAGGGEDPADLVSVAALPDLAEAMLDLLIDGESGVWHLAHPEPMGRDELVRAEGLVGDLAGEEPSSSLATVADEVGTHTPVSSALLGSERGWVMPSLARALDGIARSA
ncbi:MAG: GH1 [uncultured Thermomicrobiales bacterium]|uniref:dTDP-4-dehydrorhamnose reductase n=1 Tax=uncultured Thermomicrobiales bacterium TaxID=1645740 RepID=A0A6J4V3S6_9BACT|nr:MAG: GH1 [uncultured Thermomicrobiales bacterium]